MSVVVSVDVLVGEKVAMLAVVMVVESVVWWVDEMVASMVAS